MSFYFLINLAGDPPQISLGGMFLLTNEFAPIIEFSPIVTPGIIIVLVLIYILVLIMTGAKNIPGLLIGISILPELCVLVRITDSNPTIVSSPIYNFPLPSNTTSRAITTRLPMHIC